MVYKGNAAQLPLLQQDTTTQASMPTSDASTNDKGKGKQVLIPNTSPLKPSSSPQPTPTTSTTQPPRAQPRQKSTPCPQHMITSMSTRWIPKELLQAQGYFEGEKDVWLPRQPHHQKPTSPSKSKPRRRNIKRTQRKRRTHQRWVPVPLLEGQGFYQGKDRIWVPKRTKTAVANKDHQDKTRPTTSKRTRMVWIRKDTKSMERPCPSLPRHVPQKRAEPQEPTWRRVTPQATPQKVEPQEPAPKNKGKDKIVDVTNIASSSTSMTSTPPELKTKWVVRPKVATQEPTEGKTNPQSPKPQAPKAKTEPQEPTFAKEVEPQEPVLPYKSVKDEEHYEADILKDTKTMLKDFAHTVFATTSQVQIPQSVTMSAKRYATWVFNALP